MGRLGERVRSYRLGLGLSQKALADRAGVTQPRINQIERGNARRPHSRRTLTYLADALGVGLAELVGDDPAYDWLDIDELSGLHIPLSDLPRLTTPLVGRARDLAAIAALLGGQEDRLITLTGPAGVGKTRLALHAAAESTSIFADVTTVSLATCFDAAQIVSVVARAIGARERDRDERPLRDRLVAELRHRSGRSLLVLDNVEQALPWAAALVVELLAACPRLTILATTRRPLRVSGERIFEVLPLPIPDKAWIMPLESTADSPSVALFLQRAREVVPGFTLTEQNIAQIVAVVRRLDGIPLAIELAASRIRIFTPEQLLRQLDRRLAVLTSGPGDLPGRPRSLRDSIAWSVGLLDAEQQALLRRLTVFSGGFTLDAAATVLEAEYVDEPTVSTSPESHQQVMITLGKHVSDLLEHHLLTLVNQVNGVPRFGMLEMIHEFGREQLALAGEATVFSERHLRWCRDLAEQSLTSMYTSAGPAWLQLLHQEDENLQAALRWAFTNGNEQFFEDGLRLAGALTDYWYISGQLTEGRTWLTRALDATASRGHSIGRTRCLAGACLLEQAQSRIEPAQEHGEESLAAALALDNKQAIGRALLLLGNLEMMRGEPQLARSLHEESLAYFRHLGDRPWTALALINLGIDLLQLGEFEAAAVYTTECLAITRAVGNIWDTIGALRLLGEVARERGDLARARSHLEESLALGQRYGNQREIADSLSALATVALATGEPAPAARYLAAAETLYRRLDISIPPPIRPDWTEIVESIRASLDDGLIAAIRESASPETVVAEALGRTASAA